MKPSTTTSLPERSATCPKALEDLLIGAGERRAVKLLARVDAAYQKRTELTSILNEPEVLPVPRFMIENATLPQDAALDKQSVLTEHEQHRHASDSGLGSSLADSELNQGIYCPTFTSFHVDSLVDNKRLGSMASTGASSAITQSISGNTSDNKHCLSEYAQKQIHKFIIKPILKEESLKDFHPLIRDVPTRIGKKDITNLRDLEKTLIFLAPVSLRTELSGRTGAYWSFWVQEFSRSPAAYKSFCELSIRCLHLTVNGVHESEQCLPTDRPYTNHYFVDLVEQIRRYAAILAATREKQAKGLELTEMDVTPYVHPYPKEYQPITIRQLNGQANLCDRGEQLELHGGSGTMTRQAELVRKRDGGKSYISLADDRLVSPEEVASSSAKRSMADSFADDDGAHRSMARRKKNELPRTYTCKSSGCHKEFKRPCDLTKHVKTHERPWKCPEVGCKYHDYGWPTEKERERHVNDRHSDAPSRYNCLFEGCTYTSKRESNCKQHMEKSHGWEYVRSKNNSKGKAPATGILGSSSSPSSDSATGTPYTAAFQSPSMHSHPSVDPSRQGSTVPQSHLPGATMFDTQMNDAIFTFGADFDEHFDTSYLDAAMSEPLTPAWSNDRRASADTAGTELTNHSPLHNFGPTFDNVVKPEDFETNLFGEMNFQQPTPASSYNNLSAPQSSSIPTATYPNAGQTHSNGISPHISPGAQDLTLTSPHLFDTMHVDNAFGEDFTSDEDFQLFAQGEQSSEPLFNETSGLENMGSQFTYGSQHGGNLMDLFPELNN